MADSWPIVPLGRAWSVWTRGEADYRDGFIVLPRERAERYVPQPDPDLDELPFVLARLRTPEEAIRFVARYGLLLEHPEGSEVGAAYMERFARWEQEARRLYTLVAGLRNVDAARAGDSAALDVLREELAGRMAKGVPLPADNREMLRAVRRWLAGALSRGVVRIATPVNPPAAGAAEPEDFRRAAYLRSPLEHAYDQLARMADGGAAIMRCATPGCGHFFAPREPRHVYCTQECNDRARQWRYAAKARARRGN